MYMALPKVFVTRLILETGLAPLRGLAEVEVWPGELPPPYSVLVDRAQAVAGMLTLLTDPIDAPLLEAAGPGLKVISQMAVGYDNIDLAAATARRIAVGHTPGVLTDATADFTWALLMAAARRVIEANQFTHAGRWNTWGPMLLLGPDVTGATLGLIGFGRIGQAVARRARGFDMRVLYYDRQRRPEAEAALGAAYAALDELYAQADFVSLHAPLNAATRHLIDDSAFARMKPGAILINTARGPIVDLQSLQRALVTGRLAYAALDVTEPEPIPAGSPLLQLSNLIVTPHIASASLHARRQMASMAAANLLAGLRGERLPHCANPQIYD
jgi:glyoxylate reductase